MRYYAEINDEGYVSQVIASETLSADKRMVEIDPLAGIGDGWKFHNNEFINANIEVENSMSHYVDAAIPEQSILTDGFGRSGSSYLHSTIHDSFPNIFMRRGYKGRHVIESLSVAPKKFGAVVVTKRNPFDAIVSALAYFPQQYPSANAAMEDYMRFMEQVEIYKEDLIIVDFADLISNPKNMLDAVGKKIGCTPVYAKVEYNPIMSSRYSVGYIESVGLVGKLDLTRANNLYSAL